MFGRVTVRELLYCCPDETIAEEPFKSGTAASRNVHSLEVLVKRHRLIKSQDTRLICATMTKLKPRYKLDCGVKICEPVISHIICTNYVIVDKAH